MNARICREVRASTLLPRCEFGTCHGRGQVERLVTATTTCWTATSRPTCTGVSHSAVTWRPSSSTPATRAPPWRTLHGRLGVRTSGIQGSGSSLHRWTPHYRGGQVVTLARSLFPVLTPDVIGRAARSEARSSGAEARLALSRPIRPATRTRRRSSVIRLRHPVMPSLGLEGLSRALSSLLPQCSNRQCLVSSISAGSLPA